MDVVARYDWFEAHLLRSFGFTSGEQLRSRDGDSKAWWAGWKTAAYARMTELVR